MMRYASTLAAFLLLAGCTTFSSEPQSNYMVFFQNGSSELSTDARAVVAESAAAVRSTHPASIVVSAGTTTGDNLRLAEPRFLAVRQALVAAGIGDSIISRSAVTDASLSVGPTGDERVEITLVARPAL